MEYFNDYESSLQYREFYSNDGRELYIKEFCILDKKCKRYNTWICSRDGKYIIYTWSGGKHRDQYPVYIHTTKHTYVEWRYQGKKHRIGLPACKYYYPNGIVRSEQYWLYGNILYSYDYNMQGVRIKVEKYNNHISINE